MDSFSYNGLAYVSNLNIRKQNHGTEKKVLAVDLACEVHAPESVCAAFDEELHELFFNPEGFIKNHALEPVHFDYTFENCALDVDKQKFGKVNITNFKLAPLDGRVVLLNFTAQFLPKPDELGQLADAIKEEVQIKVSTGALALQGGGKRKNKTKNEESAEAAA
jgi:hypothetical protein